MVQLSLDLPLVNQPVIDVCCQSTIPNYIFTEEMVFRGTSHEFSVLRLYQNVCNYIFTGKRGM